MKDIQFELPSEYVRLLALRIEEELFVMLANANPQVKTQQIVTFLEEDELIARLIQKSIETFVLCGDVNPAIQVCLDEMKDDFTGVLKVCYVEGRKSF